jgi:hypothetical protein
MRMWTKQSGAGNPVPNIAAALEAGNAQETFSRAMVRMWLLPPKTSDGKLGGQFVYGQVGTRVAIYPKSGTVNLSLAGATKGQCSEHARWYDPTDPHNVQARQIVRI